MELHLGVDTLIGPPFEEFRKLSAREGIIFHDLDEEITASQFTEKMEGCHVYCAAVYKVPSLERMLGLRQFLSNGGRALLTFYARDEDDAKRKSDAYGSIISADIDFSSISPYVLDLPKPIEVKPLKPGLWQPFDAKQISLDSNYVQMSDSEVLWTPFKLPENMKVNNGNSERNDGFESFANLDSGVNIVSRMAFTSTKKMELIQKDYATFLRKLYCEENMIDRDTRNALWIAYYRLERQYMTGILSGNVAAFCGRILEDDFAAGNFDLCKQLLRYLAIGRVVKKEVQETSNQTHATGQPVTREKTVVKPIKLYPD